MSPGDGKPVVITGTGFFGEARQEVRALVKELGAVYSGQLERGLTSFLVCAQGIRSDGVAKVQKAREWRIPVVRVEWIYSSLEQGRWLPWEDFWLDEGKGTEWCHGSIEQLRSERSQSLVGSSMHSMRTSIVAATPGALSSAPLRSSMHQMLAPTSPRTGLVLPPLLPKPPTPSSADSSIPALSADATSPDDADDPQPRCRRQSCSGSSNDTEGLRLAKEGALQQVPAGTPAPPQSASRGVGPAFLAEQLRVNGYDCSPDQRVTEVRGRGKLRKPPAKSTAWAFHGTKDLTFFRELEVCMGGGAALRFDLRDSSHCALVLYAERSGYEELAYCDLWNAYALPSGEVYIEHGYLYDLNDLESHESGAAFLSQVQGIGDNELVNSRALYHSPAEVIEGEFWLFGDRLAADQAREAMAPGSLVFYTTRYWNRRTGKATLIPAGGRGKAGLSRQ